MRRAYYVLLVVCLAIFAGLLMYHKFQHSDIASAPVDSLTPEHLTVLPPSPSRPATARPSAAATHQRGHPNAPAFGTAAIPSQREPEILLGFFEFYRREFGAFPTGNENAHFLNALAGNNPTELVIFPMNHPRVSADGELLDAWGIPFYFHSISRDYLEVRSAGPDKLLFTSDDVVAPLRPRS